MRIMGSRSANLYKRSLAAKQLEAYADLCEVMEEFSALRAEHARKQARLAGFDEILSDGKAPKQPNVVDSLMKKYIPYAVENGTSFLTDPDFIAKETDGLSEAEFDRLSECFRKYSRFSDIHSSFRDAEAAFNNCVANKKGELVIRKKELKAYQEAVKAGRFSKAVSKFESNFEKHSRTYIGHEHYKITTKSLSRIALTHPEMVDRESFKRITPGTYDANIKGVYREKSKDPKKTYEALSEYEDKVPGKLKEALYTHTLGKRFTGQSIKKLLLTGAVILMVAAPVIHGAQYSQDYAAVTIKNAEEQGYDLYISNETKAQLKQAEKTLEEMKKSKDFPSVEELKGLNNLIDDNMNLIIGDLATRAVLDARPDWKVNKVKTGYNDYAAKDGEPSNSVTIEYVDEKGNTQTTVVTNFSNPNLLHGIAQAFDGENTTLEETFYSERAYDREFFDLLEVYTSSSNVTDRAEALNAIYQYFGSNIDAQNIVGAKGMVFKDGWLSDRLHLNLSNKKEIQEAAGKNTTSTVKDTGERDLDD